MCRNVRGWSHVCEADAGSTYAPRPDRPLSCGGRLTSEDHPQDDLAIYSFRQLSGDDNFPSKSTLTQPMCCAITSAMRCHSVPSTKACVRSRKPGAGHCVQQGSVRIHNHSLHCWRVFAHPHSSTRLSQCVMARPTLALKTSFSISGAALSPTLEHAILSGPTPGRPHHHAVGKRVVQKGRRPP